MNRGRNGEERKRVLDQDVNPWDRGVSRAEVISERTAIAGVVIIIILMIVATIAAFAIHTYAGIFMVLVDLYFIARYLLNVRGMNKDQSKDASLR